MEIEAEPRSDSSVVKPLNWRYLIISSAFVAFLATVTCIVASLSADGRGALTAVLAILAILLALAAVLVYRSPIPVPSPTLESGAEYIFLVCLLTCLLMIVRLFCAPVYDGQAANFNFGEECEGEEEDCTGNVAFTLNVNTIVHVLQGCLIFLLYTDITIEAWPISQKSIQKCKFIKQVMALGVCVYPTYSLVKRLLVESNYFANSSHFNNVSEWTSGNALGVCAIYVFYAWMYPRYHSVLKEQSTTAESSQLFRRSRISCGVFMLITFIFSVVFMAASWNSSLTHT